MSEGQPTYHCEICGSDQHPTEAHADIEIQNEEEQLESQIIEDKETLTLSILNYLDEWTEALRSVESLEQARDLLQQFPDRFFYETSLTVEEVKEALSQVRQIRGPEPTAYGDINGRRVEIGSSRVFEEYKKLSREHDNLDLHPEVRKEKYLSHLGVNKVFNFTVIPKDRKEVYVRGQMMYFPVIDKKEGIIAYHLADYALDEPFFYEKEKFLAKISKIKEVPEAQGLKNIFTSWLDVKQAEQFQREFEDQQSGWININTELNSEEVEQIASEIDGSSIDGELSLGLHIWCNNRLLKGSFRAKDGKLKLSLY